MKLKPRLFCVAFVTLTGALTFSAAERVQAIVTRHDRSEADHQSLAIDRAQSVELSERGGAGGATLIAPRWLLTAAHVAAHKSVGQTVVIGDASYNIANIVPHPQFSMRPIQHDVALIELDHPVDGVVPAVLYEGNDERGMQVLFVGSGDYGTGRTGPETRDRTRRAVTNEVTAVDSLWISFRFDPPGEALYHEGISGPGDSGGAAFVETDSTLYIIGVSSWQDTKATQRVEGVYGVVENYTRISTHIQWIQSILAASD